MQSLSLLALFMAGCAILHVCSSFAISFENKRLYQHPVYNMLIWGASGGMALSVASLLKYVNRIEEILQRECEYKIKYLHTPKLSLKELKTVFKKLRKNLEGKGQVSSVILMVVSFLLMAILAPIALSEVANATTTNWENAVITVFQVALPIIWVIGVAVKYIPRG